MEDLKDACGENKGLILGVILLFDSLFTGLMCIGVGFLMELDVMFYLYIPLILHFICFLIILFSEKKRIKKKEKIEHDVCKCAEPDLDLDEIEMAITFVE